MSRIGLIRVGVVQSIDAEAVTGRVFFEDLDMVSGELPIVQVGAGAYQGYSLPNVGDQVLCAFLETGEEVGFILGAIYSEEDAPAEHGVGLRYLQFADGGRIKYDTGSHILSIDASGGVDIAGDLRVDGDVHITGTCYADDYIET